MPLLGYTAEPTFLYGIVSVLFFVWALMASREIRGSVDEQDGDSLAASRRASLAVYPFAILGLVCGILGVLTGRMGVVFSVFSIMWNVIAFAMLVGHVDTTKKVLGSMLFILVLFAVYIETLLPPIRR